MRSRDGQQVTRAAAAGAALALVLGACSHPWEDYRPAGATSTGPGSGSGANGGTGAHGAGGTAGAGAGVGAEGAGAAGAGPDIPSDAGPDVVACEPNSGDCKDKSDCQAPELEVDCVELTKCGFRVCTKPWPEAKACSGSPQDQCCISKDCTKEAKLGAKCFKGTPEPQCCGEEVAVNYCVADACTKDADCDSSGSPQACVPGGTMGRPMATCVDAPCKLDSDCKVEKGGICAPVTKTTCDRPAGLFCVYPSDGCRSDADCPEELSCLVASGRASCKPNPVKCQ
ncbi:MAG: hypothetical protein HY744_33915 [Deltaproteobacteria bacterium]|nr:hypothetical protein [Deltaproteobacteria bacterium]